MCRTECPEPARQSSAAPGKKGKGGEKRVRRGRKVQKKTHVGSED